MGAAPMPGSVSANLRARLSPEMRALCEAIDSDIASVAARPPHEDQRINDWRDGYRDALVAVRTSIERSAA